MIQPQLRAYHGTLEEGSFYQVEAIKATPIPDGHLRIHTVESFVPPVRMGWWIYPMRDMRLEDKGTSGGEHMDGLHVHFAHQDNQLNGLIHLVRRDGKAKVSTQHGHAGYDDLHHGEGLVLRTNRRYLFDLVWEPDRVQLQVSNDHFTGSLEKPTPAIESRFIWSDLPGWMPRFGQMGFRLDNLECWIGKPVVRKL